jgi:hypothetical protein
MKYFGLILEIVVNISRCFGNGSSRNLADLFIHSQLNFDLGDAKGLSTFYDKKSRIIEGFDYEKEE